MRHHWAYGIRAALLVVLLMPTISQTQEEEAGEAEPATGAVTTRYVNIKPEFIANYGGAGRLRYLKTDVTLRVGEPSVSAVRRHMPYIRHVLVKTLSSATEEEVGSMEGRELIRQNALKAVQDILQEEEGEQYVTDLLFNAFIVQR